MLVVCGTASCARTKSRSDSEVSDSTSHAKVALDVSIAVETTRASVAETPASAPSDATDFKRAMLEHDYARARRLVDTAGLALRPATLELLRGFLALHDTEPLRALEHFERAQDVDAELTRWLDSLRAEALLRTDSYVEHLEALTARAPLARLLAVTERLLADGRFSKAEHTLALAQSRSSGDQQNGEVRWLRVRLRQASGRSNSVHADVRWLVGHPDHPRSPEAMAAIERGEQPPLTVTELWARAEAAAELGLVEVVQQCIIALKSSAGRTPSQGEYAYLQGLALHRARRFDEAVGPLDEAVRALATRRDRARYLAAVATSRAGAGSDAVARFAAISALRPATETVQNASFALAREHSMLGNWTSASEQFSLFLSQFPNHELAEAAERERLIAWFAEGNYKRFVYWVRQFRERRPDAKETLLLRSVEALALYRLGHPELARAIWEDLARAAPLAFVGITARQRLAQLGAATPATVVRTNGAPAPDVELPPLVAELELAGLSEQAEAVFRKIEPAWARAHAPNEAAASCASTAYLERGRRRFELGREAAAKRGLKDAPQLAPSWLWPCLFPSPHANGVARHAATHQVSPALIYAVMRQESAFRVDAVSVVGARGLMQIIEPTARRIAAELGHTYDPEHLDVPHHNIEYGAFYLGKLQAHFEHPALVAAAYNAGPDAAARWHAAGRSLPLEAFIARIPYDETRSYVQRVLENLHVYGELLGTNRRPEWPLELAPKLGDAAAPSEPMHRAPEGFY